jgi:hypothetical protein
MNSKEMNTLKTGMLILKKAFKTMERPISRISIPQNARVNTKSITLIFKKVTVEKVAVR